MPNIEDFAKFDFRVAKIVEANDHPNADKLIVLKIDLGEKESVTNENQEIVEVPKYRQIVAGIKKSYSKEDLVGKLIVVVSNLEPAVLRGVESQGMLLAATDSEGLPILITPEKEVNVGAKVK